MKQFRTCMRDLLEERMETVLDSIAHIREEVSAVPSSTSHCLAERYRQPTN